MVKRLSTLVVVALAGGCVDAKGAYDDYATRVVDGGVDAPPSSECPSPGGAADFSGANLLLHGGGERPPYLDAVEG